MSTDGGRPNFRLDVDEPLYVAGHRGLVGSALWRLLLARGHSALIGASSTELDLRDRPAVFDFFSNRRPRYVVLAAAHVGGIKANSTRPVDFLSDNIQIQVNVLDAANAFSVERLLFLGSSCIYPKYAKQPIKESALMTGPLESTNEAYAIAKIAGIIHIQSLRRQFNRSYISAMPTNLYGPGDNFDLQTSHVLPALIRRLHEAKVAGQTSVNLWGSGDPRREFLHVDDLAAACVTLLERYDEGAPINVGTGADIRIRELVSLIGQIVDYRGEIRWDTTQPDGTPQKLLDNARIQQLDWKPTIDLREGIRSTYDWYCAHIPLHKSSLSRIGTEQPAR